MSRFVQGADRRQQTLLPECLDDYVAEDNPVRVVDVFVDELDLKRLGFEGMTPAATGRPAYHQGTLLKLYVYGYLNKVQSSRRLEREAQRNVELMWLTGRLAPDHKTIADFRRENGAAIQAACAQFVVLCRQLGLFGAALVAIDGSKFKAVNTRDRNFTAYKVKRRIEQVAEHIAGYLQDLDTADRQEGEAVEARSGRLVEKIDRLRAQMTMLKAMEAQVEASPDSQVSLTDPDARAMATSGRGSGIVGYNVQSAVEGEHHLIVAHDVIMTGSAREQLTPHHPPGIRPRQGARRQRPDCHRQRLRPRDRPGRRDNRHQCRKCYQRRDRRLKLGDHDGRQGVPDLARGAGAAARVPGQGRDGADHGGRRPRAHRPGRLQWAVPAHDPRAGPHAVAARQPQPVRTHAGRALRSFWQGL